MGISVADLQGIIDKQFGPLHNEWVPRNNTFLQIVNKKGLVYDAVRVRGIATRQTPNGSQANGADVAVVSTDHVNYQAYELPFKTYTQPFFLEQETVDQLAYQPEAFGEFMLTEIEEAANVMGDAIAADIFKLQTGNAIFGLPDWLSNSTIGGIDRSVYTALAGVTYDADAAGALAAQPLSTAILQGADRAYFDQNKKGIFDSMDRWTLLANGDVYEKYLQIFDSLEAGSLNNWTVNGDNNTGRIGQTTVGYANAPLLRDPNISPLAGDLANSNRMYAVNWDAVDMCFMDFGQLGASDVAARASLERTKGYMQGRTLNGIPFRTKILGTTGQNIQGYTYCYVQLAAHNPRATGVAINNIDVS